ncbi:DNA ligase 3 [Euwallacea similis]|uniref:DNA ligase 3 n=1 Tax=Euwallacea similis TaxID=1736056 RepID=UPI00344D6926
MSATEEERVFEVELAKNGRAGCKKCKQKCLQGELRIAKITPNPFSDGKMKNWHHVDCLFEVFKKQRVTTKRIESEDDIIGFDLLSDDNQLLIVEKIKVGNQLAGVSKKSPKKTETTEVKLDEKSVVNSENQDKDNLFKTFQKIVRKVANHPSYLEKTAIIKNIFEKGSKGDGFKGDIEIWCRLLLPGSVKRIYNLQSKQLIKLFSRIFLEDHDQMLEHLEEGDISDTISHFYTKSRKYSPIPTKSTITIQKVDKFLDHLSKMTKEDDQITHFTKILKQLTAEDLKTIIRLIKHDLRMGAGAKHILEGVHPDAYSVYQASKDLDGVVEKCFGNSKDQSAEIKILTPVFPMLAEACKSVEYALKKCPNGMFSEIKYDGERVQVHKQGNHFKYYSRSLKPVMPHKVAHFKEYISKAFPHAKDLILDTEILMMDTKTGKPLPFGTLGVHKKAQFRDATVCLFVFDCIYYNGESLANKSLKDRKQILNENMKEVPNHIVFSEMQEIDEPKKLAEMIAKVLKLGLEGLVLKDKLSKYEPGKRHWLKIKKDYLFGGAMADSADLIVLGAWYGTGQKGGMMSIFLMGCYNERSKKFCTVTKVHTGHDDKTLEKLQKQLKMEKISGDPNKVPNWLHCTRTLVPDFVAANPKQQPVWEITGAEFTQQHDVHTADGISIRFPRVTKIRDDKTWETATNLEELKLLFKNSKENTDVSLLLKEYKEEVDITDAESSTSLNSVSPKKRKMKSDRSRDSSGCESPEKRRKEEKNCEVKKKKSIEIINPLPNMFGDFKAIFVTSHRSDAERYFLAYGGFALKPKDFRDATHIFHLHRTTKDISSSFPKTAKHLHVTWIIDSVNKAELLPIEYYVVTWEPVQNSEDELIFNKVFQS